MRDIKYIIIHCSDSPDSRDSVNAAEIRKWHLERGWSDIGYHFVICRNGEIETGRSLDVAGSHCKGYNISSIGVCLVGGAYGDGRPNNTDDISHYSSSQILALKQLIYKLKSNYPECKVRGHRDFNSDKTCPNFDVRFLDKI